MWGVAPCRAPPGHDERGHDRGRIGAVTHPRGRATGTGARHRREPEPASGRRSGQPTGRPAHRAAAGSRGRRGRRKRRGRRRGQLGRRQGDAAEPRLAQPDQHPGRLRLTAHRRDLARRSARVRHRRRAWHAHGDRPRERARHEHGRGGRRRAPPELLTRSDSHVGSAGRVRADDRDARHRRRGPPEGDRPVRSGIRGTRPVVLPDGQRVWITASSESRAAVFSALDHRLLFPRTRRTRPAARRVRGSSRVSDQRLRRR